MKCSYYYAGFSTAAEDGVGEHRVWGRLKRLKRRRHKSTTSATTQSHPAHLNHEHSHHPQQQNQIVLQSVKNDGTVATDSLSVSNGKIIHNKTSATVSNRVSHSVLCSLGKGGIYWGWVWRYKTCCFIPRCPWTWRQIWRNTFSRHRQGKTTCMMCLWWCLRPPPVSRSMRSALL